MYHMKRASIRDLRYNFPKIRRLLRSGEDIEVTDRNKVIAKLVPVKEEPFELPPFEERIRKIFGDKKMEVSTAELLAWDRDRY